MADFRKLEELAKLVRYYILTMTTRAGSGHPTSSLSATDLMVALYFGKLKFNLKNPQEPNNDRVIFSKGHASPLFYALYRVAGAISDKELENYRKKGSVLEGHPRPNFKFAEAATGSLGQGLSIGLGMAMDSKMSGTSNSVYVLLGDSEMAEGSIWEAVELASYYKTDNLVGIIDVNRLGQRGETMYGWNTRVYEQKMLAFGWETHVIDGHDLEEIARTLANLPVGSGRPQMIIAKTIKGRGVPFLEDKEGWHGKVLNEEELTEALFALGSVDRKLVGKIISPEVSGHKTPKLQLVKNKINLDYKIGDMIATRKAYGEMLAEVGSFDTRVVALDGETKNSTFSEIFEARHPQRFFEMFIAEQNMVGVAIGMSRLGKVPFVSTFSAFLTRAHDQIRMAAYSGANIKFVGTHSGVSIGEDGPSQMGLEDIAMFRSVIGSTVLVPADAVSCARLVEESVDLAGVVYLRTARPVTPVIYDDSEKFKIGGSKVLRQSSKDKVTVIACGVMVSEVLLAYKALFEMNINIRVVDAYSIKPIDEKTITDSAKKTNGLVLTVEDHYFEGGLGDAVFNVFADNSRDIRVTKLAVTKMPMSATGDQLLEYEGINSSAIVSKIREILK
jgi:transketolase